MQAERARLAVASSFALNGFAFASWVARVPAARDRLGLGPGRLGLLLLCLTAGATVTLPVSGALVQRLSPARAVLAGSALVAAGISCAGVGLGLDSATVTGSGLLVLGVGNALWDVAMNVEGAAVERHLGRVLMPRLHAGFSVGTVAGAAVGAGCAALAAPVSTQLVVTGPLLLAAVGCAVRAYLPAVAPALGESAAARARAVWREPRTLAIGLLVLTFALTEGVANDWLALAVRDGHRTSDAVGAGVFGAFVTAMTVMRTAGGALLQRFGRPPVLRGSAVGAAAGLLLVVFGPGLAWAVAGAVLWGSGAALGFPVGMSAAADDPQAAAPRVGVVSTIGYSAFLGGPPLVGFLAEQVGVVHALLFVAVGLIGGAVLAGVARPVPDREPAAVAVR